MKSKGVDSIFIKKILYDEWSKFRTDQDAAISSALKRRSGTLHAGGRGRRYSIKPDGAGAIATLIHPDYERYQDMKRLTLGRSKLGTQPIKTKSGKKIHNRLIWGRMNSISFRLSNDMRREVIKTVRRDWGNGKLFPKSLLDSGNKSSVSI